MVTLSEQDVVRELKSLNNGWSLEGKAIKKQFTFNNFPAAVAFVSRLVPECESADHHPDILINYRRVTLTYSTHSEDALTQKDFDGAAMADRHARGSDGA